MAIYKNLTTVAIHTLIARGGSDSGAISKIIITNTDTLPAEDVEVYIDDSTNKYYFIKGVDIPVGASLVLDEGLDFNKIKYALMLRTYADSGTGTPSLTVIIK